MPRLGSRVRIPSPAPNKSPENQHERCVSCGDFPASIGLNEPRTVPKRPADLGKRRAKRSRKVPDGPPQKRSPASPASENGAIREIKCSDRKFSAAGPNAQELERHFYWIAHGQTNVGFVEQVEEDKTLGADERDLGSFDSLKAAADAVTARYDQNSCAELLLRRRRMSAPAFKVSDEQTLGAVASALHDAINRCSNPNQLARDGATPLERLGCWQNQRRREYLPSVHHRTPTPFAPYGLARQVGRQICRSIV